MKNFHFISVSHIYFKKLDNKFWNLYKNNNNLIPKPWWCTEVFWGQNCLKQMFIKVSLLKNMNVSEKDNKNVHIYEQKWWMGVVLSMHQSFIVRLRKYNNGDGQFHFIQVTDPLNLFLHVWSNNTAEHLLKIGFLVSTLNQRRDSWLSVLLFYTCQKCQSWRFKLKSHCSCQTCIFTHLSDLLLVFVCFSWTYVLQLRLTVA